MYHEGSRQLQDRFAPRRFAARLVEVVAHGSFTDADCAFIESRPLFVLATADGEGRPDCSYKGGRAGFVRVVDAQTLAFPSHDGNGLFKSLGNILVNPHVGLLFVDFESPQRLRVNGRAALREDDPLLAEFVGAQLVVRVQADAVFPNCPRYIHKMQAVEESSSTAALRRALMVARMIRTERGEVGSPSWCSLDDVLDLSFAKLLDEQGLDEAPVKEPELQASATQKSRSAGRSVGRVVVRV